MERPEREEAAARRKSVVIRHARCNVATSRPSLSRNFVRARSAGGQREHVSKHLYSRRSRERRSPHARARAINPFACVLVRVTIALEPARGKEPVPNRVRPLVKERKNFVAQVSPATTFPFAERPSGDTSGALQIPLFAIGPSRPGRQSLLAE